MSTLNNPAALLAALLAGFATGKVEVTEIDLDPNLSVEEQISAIAEKAAAAHREECPDCRAEYEAEQKAKEAATNAHDVAKTVRPNRDLDALVEKTKAEHEAERMELAKKHSIERNKLMDEVNREKSERARFTGMKPEMGAPYGDSKNYLAQAGALRQFRHNNGEPGIVFGYEKTMADKAVDALLKEVDALKAQIRALVQKG